MKTALIVDVETTGLSPSRDEIIEFAGLAFSYDEEAQTIGQIIDTYSGLRQPAFPIPLEAQKVNRITDEMVRGQKLDDQRILSLFASADIVIAHNVKFDKAFLTRLYPACAEKTWRCSMNDINWEGKGHSFISLQKLSKSYSIKVSRSAHRALVDCQIVYQLLSIENLFKELLVGLTPRIVSLSSSYDDIYPVQIEGEKTYFRNLEKIVQYYDDEEGCDEDWHEAFLFNHEQPDVLERQVFVKIDDLTVGYLKPATAKKYLKRLAALGAPANAIGHCYASIRGGKMINGFKTNLGVRLDFDLKEFEIKPYASTKKEPSNEPVSMPSVELQTEPKVLPTPISTPAQPKQPEAVAPPPAPKSKLPLIPIKGKGCLYFLFVLPVILVINLYILLFAGLWQIGKWLWKIGNASPRNQKISLGVIGATVFLCVVSSFAGGSGNPTPPAPTIDLVAVQLTALAEAWLPYTQTAQAAITNTSLPTATLASTETATLAPLPTATLQVFPTATTFLQVLPINQSPTSPPAGQSAVCSCAGDSYNCTDFSTHASAQACFNYCQSQGAGDIHRLDQNNDGSACESLP